MNDTPTPKTDSEAELTLIDCDDSSVEIYVKQDSKIVHGDIVLADFARQLERERDAALATNAELLERLRERTESHLAASARDVQTIQRQSVMLERLAAALKSIAWVEETGNRDYSWTGDTAFEALSAYAKRQP